MSSKAEHKRLVEIKPDVIKYVLGRGRENLKALQTKYPSLRIFTVRGEKTGIAMEGSYGQIDLCVKDVNNYVLSAYAYLDNSLQRKKINKEKLAKKKSIQAINKIKETIKRDEEEKAAMEIEIENAKKGILVYMNQEGRGIGLLNKLKAYELQENGRDTVEANIELGFLMDHRDYGIGAQILRAMDVRKIKLLSNNPKKRVGLSGYGIEIVDSVPIEIESNEHNKFYLQTKRDKMGHSLKKLDE